MQCTGLFTAVATLALALPIAAIGAVTFADAYDAYTIQTNSPVHVTGTGNEVVLVYGDAPGAHLVEITIHDTVYESAVRDGSFHLTIPAPPPGTYGISGVWTAEETERDGDSWTTSTTTGHLSGGLLTVLGRGFDDTPDGIVTVMPGAGSGACADCVEYTDDVIPAGGYALVSNADTEKHQFSTDSPWAVHSTGNLDPGESVRLPLNAEGHAEYRCIYHPWLAFVVHSTGMYVPADRDGAIHLETPPYAGDSVRIGITHTGGASMAHVVFIQDGQVLNAGVADLVGGYGSYIVDSSGWRVGEVIVSVSAGADHAADTISVRPPPGAAERSGRVTGYEGLDGVLINGGLARPAGIIPLDAALDATRQLCALDKDALFRGDTGLESRGAHYTEGTIWCDGVNLGVYLLEGGLAIVDPSECGIARSEWLKPYCRPGMSDGQPTTGIIPGAAQDADAPQDVSHGEPQDADAPQDVPHGAPQDTPSGDTPATEPDDQSYVIVDTRPDTGGDMEIDIPAVPDSGGPEFETVGDTCDHIIDPTCPCPDGWVRDGDWCNPEWSEGMDAAGEAVGGAAGEAGEVVGGAMEGVREGIVENIGGFFGWIAEWLSEIPKFFVDLITRFTGA